MLCSMGEVAGMLSAWRPLAAGGLAVAVSVAVVALLVAAVLAFLAVRSRADSGHRPIEDELEPATDAPDGPPQLALEEAERERDVSIARLAEAEERERLARERLLGLAPLEQRIEIAERRALDAERRLDEIADRMSTGGAGTADPPEPKPGPEPSTEPSTGDDAVVASPDDRAARQAAELRARLARTADRKKPRPG
jgi:hypothetical protein